MSKKNEGEEGENNILYGCNLMTISERIIVGKWERAMIQ